MKKSLIAAFLVLLSFFAPGIDAQDFGFGSRDDDADSGFGFSSPGFSAPSFKISGEVSAELRFFFSDMESAKKFGKTNPGNIFSGSLDFSASGSAADALINLKIVPDFDGNELPVQLGEAYGRAYFGPVTLEAGLRKLSWGRADGFGPLDVTNPLDYSDLSRLSDPQSIKIARPMLHVTLNTGSFSRLEAVLVPWFQGHTFATDPEDRWMPAQMKNQMNSLQAGIEGYLTQQITKMYLEGKSTEALALQTAATGLASNFEGTDIESLYEDLYSRTNTLKYAQAGLRFTTTAGSSDLGFQYYFGRLPRPALGGIDLDKLIVSDTLNPGAIGPKLEYNYYHQIGADFAMVIAGFNARAEIGANITGDLKGTDGAVYNPAIVYSLGFDRDLFAGINLNLQGSGSIRLMHGKIKDNWIDIEKDAKVTSTRITGVLSRNFLRDELELKTTALWGIEDGDCLIMPALTWSRNDVSAELQAGFFAGDRKGELGQYWKNNYIRTGLTFRF